MGPPAEATPMTRRKKVFLGVAAVLLAVVGGAYLLPGEVVVERAVTIEAPPETIYGLIAEVGTWPAWTAWDEKRDPTVRYDFFGPASGVGAGYHWHGEEYGEGRLVLRRSDPATGIEFDTVLDGGRYRSHGAIRLAAGEAGTRVTWVYAAELGRNPVGRYFGLLMDRLIGPDLELSLERLKRKAESLPPPPPPTEDLPGEAPPEDPGSPASASSRR